MFLLKPNKNLSSERGRPSNDNSPLGDPGHVRRAARPHPARGLRHQLVHPGRDPRALVAALRGRAPPARCPSPHTVCTQRLHTRPPTNRGADHWRIFQNIYMDFVLIFVNLTRLYYLYALERDRWRQIICAKCCRMLSPILRYEGPI